MKTLEAALEQELLRGLQSGDPKPISESFWQHIDGEISLEKLTEKLSMEKSVMDKELDEKSFSIINYSAEEVDAEIDGLLQ